MNPIKTALNKASKLPASVNRDAIRKTSLLRSKEIKFIEYIFENKVNCLTVYDRDLDGSTGLAGGVYASNNGTLHENWYHSYSWSKAETKGHTFGVSIDQIRHFYEHRGLPEDTEVVIFTVDNGATASPVIKQAKEEYKNIKFFITDHHRSTDDTEEVADYFIDPTDSYIKGKSDWIVYKDEKTGEEFESHVSGGMLWNLILREISYIVKNKSSQLTNLKTQIDNEPDTKKSELLKDRFKKVESGEIMPFHKLLLNFDIDKEADKAFHMRVGLMSQYCDMITYGPDWEETFRVNLKNNNLQRLPIFQIVKDNSFSKMSDSNWTKCFKEKIRQVSSKFNATKRLDFLLKNDNFKDTLERTGFEDEDLNGIKLTSVFGENDAKTLEEKIVQWESYVAGELSLSAPSVIVGELSNLKYVYLFGLIGFGGEVERVTGRIIENLATIKNKFVAFNKPQREDTKNIHFYYTENELLRGITSITCFIEKRLPLLFNLAKSGETEEGYTQVSGSFRADIDGVFDVFNSKEFKYGQVRLAGHNKAAGATLAYKTEEKEAFYQELSDTVDEIIKDAKIEIQELTEISFSDIIESENDILNNQNYYVFSEPLVFRIKREDLINNNNVKLLTARSGMTFINHSIKRNPIFISGFNAERIYEEENLEIEITVDSVNKNPKIKISIL